MVSLRHTLQDELKEEMVSMGWKRHKGFPKTGLDLGLEGLAKKGGGRHLRQVIEQMLRYGGRNKHDVFRDGQSRTKG